MARKRDLRRVDAIVAEFGMTPDQGLAFRDYLHACKHAGLLGSANERGDFTIEELRERASEYLEMSGAEESE